MAISDVNVANAPATVDGETLVAGDRVLLQNQATGHEKGLWLFNGSGNALTRPADFGMGSVLQDKDGLTLLVEAGTLFAGKLVRLITPGTVVVGTTTTNWSIVKTNVLGDNAQGLLDYTHGGTGQSVYTAGDLLYAPGSGLGKLAVGSAFQVLRTNPGTGYPAWGGIPYIHLQDQKAQNTAGGTFTSGALRTRTLNTEVTDTDNLCSLASNQFTLAAGTYFIIASVPAFGVDRNQAILRNVTGSTTLIVGSSATSAAASLAAVTGSWIIGQFEVAASQALEVQHQGQTTRAGSGFGLETNFTTEVYTDVNLWRVG